MNPHLYSSTSPLKYGLPFLLSQVFRMLSHCGFFFLRSPVLPFATISNLSVSNTWELCQDHYIQEALFLASPALYEVFERWQQGQLTDAKETAKLEVTLAKYLLRMGYRSTPFGLFAGISRGVLANNTSIEFVDRSAFRKHVRLDMDYLCALALSIGRDPAIREHLTYYPNTTLYKTSSSLRLVEYRVFNRIRTHHLIKLDANPYLDKALAFSAQGATVATIAQQLVDEEVTLADALDFVHELLDSQILVSQLEPTVTGLDYLNNIIKIVELVPGNDSLVSQLQPVRAALQHLRTVPVSEAVQAYRDMERLLKSLGVSYELGQLFQVDLHKPTVACSVNEAVAKEIQRTLKLLLHVCPPEPAKNLTRFREEFYKRYESQEVSLAMVLDADMGIGYPFQQGASSDQAPLLNELLMDASSSEAKAYEWTAWHKLLFKAYLSVINRQETVLRLDEVDLSAFTQSRASFTTLPNSFYSMVSVLAASPQAVDEGSYTLLYHGTDGPSAANYMGRFCYLDEQLTHDVKSCLAREASNFPDAILAEVVHINQSRTGNLIIRPVLRDYEIPILVQSGVDEDHTLPLHDLLLSIRDGRLVLRSQKLGCEVIPRMSTAHNYFHNTLPSYHFLCDLQHQEQRVHAPWDWGPVGEAEFLPRVEYGKVILSKAQWVLNEHEINLFKSAEPEAALLIIKALRNQRRLPQWVCIQESDNELPLDLENVLSIRVLQSLIKAKNKVTVQECLLNQPHTFVQGQGESFNNEIVIPWQFTANVPRRPIMAQKAALELRQPRHFGIGSEWAYFKIYCGVKTADQVLTQYLKPLADTLLAEGLIDQWFFIRYADPDHHLRVRFHGQNTFYASVIERIHQLLQPLAATMQIRDYSAESYLPELERYGVQTMALSETIFWRDSEAVTQIISLLDVGEAGDDLRWLVGMRGADLLLEDFGFSLEEKKEFFNALQERSKKEFNIRSASSKKSLGNRYRKERPRIEAMMSAKPALAEELLPIFSALTERSLAWRPAIAEVAHANRAGLLEVNYIGLLESYVHMFLNRLFRSKQRIQEMVLYDFLHQHYASAMAQQRGNHRAAKPEEIVRLF